MTDDARPPRPTSLFTAADKARLLREVREKLRAARAIDGDVPPETLRQLHEIRVRLAAMEVQFRLRRARAAGERP